MNKKKQGLGSTVGIGYISIMLIFTVICLTILAVLGFQAVYSNDRVSGRSEQFTREYYAADMEAKKTLAILDEAAVQAADGFSFEESFTDAAQEIDGVITAMVPEGVRVDYSVVINDRQQLSVSVVFFSSPAGERYRILRWQSGTEADQEESSPAVWDGSDLV